MEWLFKRFLERVGLDSHNEEYEEACKEYGKLVEIHIKNKCNYGDVYTNEEFAKSVESGYFVSYDGIGYYIGIDLIKTNISVDFDAETIRSKADKCPYVFWYNK